MRVSEHDGLRVAEGVHAGSRHGHGPEGDAVGRQLRSNLGVVLRSHGQHGVARRGHLTQHVAAEAGEGDGHRSHDDDPHRESRGLGWGIAMRHDPLLPGWVGVTGLGHGFRSVQPTRSGAYPARPRAGHADLVIPSPRCQSPTRPVQAVRQPTFALTLDTELIWGSFDHTPPDRFERSYPDIRGTIEAILRLLERYEVAATWAVIGHLFLGSCDRADTGLAHPELVRPGQSWRPGDWYDADPCTDRGRDPLWYGPDVLDMLQAASVPQEIGCHSFGHALYGDPSFTRDAAVSDLEACIAGGRRAGHRTPKHGLPAQLRGLA